MKEGRGAGRSRGELRGWRQAGGHRSFLSSLNETHVFVNSKFSQTFLTKKKKNYLTYNKLLL